MPLRRGRVGAHAMAALVVAAVAGVAHIPASGAEESLPASFGAQATASGMHAVLDSNPALTLVADLIHVEVPYATSDMSTSETSSTAASVYPGGGLLGVPGLVCFSAPQLCQQPPPDYPLLAKAEHPTRPEASAPVSGSAQELGPVTAAPNVIKATAKETATDALVQSGTAGLPGAVTADDVRTTTKSLFEGRTLVVTAETVLKGVSIGGGAITIDSLRSLATARVDDGKVSKSDATTTATGVVAGGQPAEIDEQGIHIGGQGDDGQANKGANDALQQALSQAGISMRVLPPTKTAKPGAARAATGGVLIVFDREVTQAPPLPFNVNRQYFGSVSIGGAGVTAFAGAGAATDALPDIGLDDVAVPGTTGGGAAAGGAAGAGAADLGGGAALPPSIADDPAAAASPEVAAGDSGSGIGPLVRDIVGDRVETLALLLLLYPVVVLLGSRLRAPAHLPRSGA